MRTSLKIVLLVLAVQLPLNAGGETGSSHISSKVESAVEPRNPLGHPLEYPCLYIIHYQAESPAEITNRVPQPQPTAERKFEPFRSSAPESAIEQWLIFYINVGNVIEPGLTIRKLIFPFHFFL
jgi:hypothetical protein